MSVTTSGFRCIERRTCPRPLFGETLPPLLQRLYAARGVTVDRELDYGLRVLAAPPLLAGAEQAAEILARAIRDNRRILFLGDFDADGATSTAVGVLGLRMLGARQVDYRVPSRFADGYGLTPGIVTRLQQEGAIPDVLVTVDNGISAHEGVAAAKALGMQVIVTDHHLAGRTLPDADAIVNPNQPDCDFPSKYAAGVGVIFYVLMVLRRLLRDQGEFAGRPEPVLADLLDLVALGTVADVVPLDHNNRILVEQGLRRIRQSQARPGILALLEIAGRDPARITATDLGFVIGPRLNAAGRLDDMSIGIECLLATDPERARVLATELDTLNRERRTIETGMREQAQVLLSGLSLDTEGLPWGLCLFESEWHQGVIGILASRIREQVNRPVMAFARGDDDGLTLKGSARSIPGLHVRDVIADIDARHPGLISHFGGHAMAAGLTLPATHFDRFAQAFDQRVREVIDPKSLQATIVTDGELARGELSLETARLLRHAGPWGQHFPEPLFDGVFRLVQQRVVGTSHLKLVVQRQDSDELFDAIAFNQAMLPDGSPGRLLTLVYRPDMNEFRGQVKLQLLVEYLGPV